MDGVTLNPKTSEAKIAFPRVADTPTAMRHADLGSDVFVRSSGPEAEAQKIAALISEVALELKGIQLADSPDGVTLPLSAGQLSLALPAQASGTAVPVSRVDLRLNSGRYAVDFTVSQDGTLKIRSFYRDGQSASVLLREALKDKISEDPILWGSLTLLAATGAVAAAHHYVSRTGDPLKFDVLDTTVMEHGPWSLRAKVGAELTGDDRFMRAAGAGSSVVYQDGRLRTEVGARYSRDQQWEAEASASYAISKNVEARANARYRNDDYQVGISIESKF